MNAQERDVAVSSAPAVSTRVGTAWRAGALALFVLSAVRHLHNSEYWSLLSGVILGTHELGHVLFAPFGEWMSIAGGTVLQLLAPVVAGALLLRQREYIGVAIAGAWLAASLAGVAVYMADASRGELPLVSIGGGDDATHDWTYLFDSMDLIRSDQIIAARTRGTGWTVLGLSFILGFWHSLRGLGASPAMEGGESAVEDRA